MAQRKIELAIEVSRYIRRLLRELFQAGSGVPIDEVAYMLDDEETGIIDELDLETDEWQWVNAVLMLMRTIHGILENAETVIEEDL